MSDKCGIEKDIQTPTPDHKVNLKEELALSVYKSINSVSELWDQLNSKGIYNSSAYLTALESSMPKDLRQFYCILYKSGTPIGCLFFQIKHMDLGSSLNVHTHSHKFIDKLTTNIKRFILNLVKHDLLVIGNVLLTGQYGVCLSPSFDLEQKIHFLDIAMEGFAAFMNKNEGCNVKSILIKDFKTETDNNVKVPGFTEFTVDPYMQLQIRPNWKSFDNYLTDLKSKYRVRFKRARKKGHALTTRELDLNDMNQFKDRMNELYKLISENVTFNLFDLDPEYFISLKHTLKDNLHVVGVFEGDKMLAFYTLIKDENKNIYDAHFLGYEMASNHDKQLYLNMLYYMIEDAIKEQVDSLHMSRTAMEIKSSVGATGEELFLLLKYRGNFVNNIMAKYLSSFIPDNSWTPREPFKGN